MRTSNSIKSHVDISLLNFNAMDQQLDEDLSQASAIDIQLHDVSFDDLDGLVEEGRRYTMLQDILDE